MRKRLKIYGVVIVAVVAVISGIGYFSTELSAIIWHLRHGFYAEVSGIRVRVPLAFEASGPDGLPRLSLVRMGGHVWQGGGSIDIDFHRQPSLEAIRLLESRATLSKKKLGEETASFAGRTGNCVESIPVTENKTLQALFQESDLREIDCWFGGNVEVTFRGTPNVKDDFYSVIRTATPSQGNAK